MLPDELVRHLMNRPIKPRARHLGGPLPVGRPGRMRGFARALVAGIAWLTLIGCWPAAGHAARSHIVRLDLSGKMQFLRDPQGALTFPEVFDRAQQGGLQPTTGTVLNFGVTGDAVWLKVPVENASDQPQTLLLEIDYPYLDDVEFHLPPGSPAGTTSVRTGDHRPFDSREFDHRNFVLPVTLPAHGSTDVYLRARTGTALQLPISVFTVGGFAETEQQRLLLLGSYFGIALAMALYNLMLGVGLRDSAYFHYVVFVVFFGMFHLALDGFGYQYLYPDLPRMGNQAHYVFLGVAIAACLQFTRVFFGSRTLAPRLHRFTFWLQVLALGLSAVACVADGQAIGVLSQACGLIASVTAFALGVIALRSGFAPARWYLLSFAAILTSSVAMVCRNFGLLSWSTFTAYGTQIGAGVEVLFLGLALADRIRMMQHETESSQRQALDLAFRAERDLEARVQARTLELAAVNTRLMVEIDDRLRTEERLRESEDRLRRLAQYDALTGVANRHLLADHLAATHSTAVRFRRGFAIVAIDLDRFKEINDSLGHEAGDRLLIGVAERLTECIRPSDTVARTGGDEFVLLLPDVQGSHALDSLFEKVRDAVERPLIIGEHTVVPMISVGAAVFPEHGNAVDALLRHADLAMYRNKHLRRQPQGSVLIPVV